MYIFHILGRSDCSKTCSFRNSLYKYEAMSEDSMGRKQEKGANNVNKLSKEKVKVAEISYGVKNLTDCMESIIRLHMEK